MIIIACKNEDKPLFILLILAPSAVQNLNVVEISPRTVNVSWTPPLYPNGIIRSYHILYTAEDETVSCPNLHSHFKVNLYYIYTVK